MLKINYETIKSLDEYDDNESNSTAEEKNYDRCRIKDESSIGDMDSDYDKAPLNVILIYWRYVMYLGLF